MGSHPEGKVRTKTQNWENTELCEKEKMSFCWNTGEKWGTRQTWKGMQVFSKSMKVKEVKLRAVVSHQIFNFIFHLKKLSYSCTQRNAQIFKCLHPCNFNQNINIRISPPLCHSNLLPFQPQVETDVLNFIPTGSFSHFLNFYENAVTQYVLSRVQLLLLDMFLSFIHDLKCLK